MSMVSRQVASFLGSGGSAKNASGKIPPAPSQNTYRTEDFNAQPVPENVGNEPVGEAKATLAETLQSVKEQTFGTRMPHPEAK
jgi:hypothetical protein